MNKLIISFALLFLQVASYAQNVGIGTNSPDSSAILELSSNNKGFLPPRMTTNEKNTIAHPANGLVIFNTTTNCLEMYVYNKWQNVFCGVADSTTNVDSTLLTDIDGNTYPTVKICNQTWMAKNLDVARYRNGDIIPQVTDPTEWSNLTTGAWCWYNNDSATYGSVYGKLYNWYAVNDPRGLAPQGWHVASDGEWNKLVKCLDDNADTNCINCYYNTNAGKFLKESGTAHWISPNAYSSDSVKFSAIPGGNRDYQGNFLYVDTYQKGMYGFWWTSTQASNSKSINRELHYDKVTVPKWTNFMTYGYSVRCVKDTPITTLNDGLVAYYPFSGNANDESGNGNNGVVNGATLTTDRFGNSGKAYSFDGNDDYINCGNSPSVNISGDISISAWIKANNFNNDHGIVSKLDLYDVVTNSNNSIPPLDRIRWEANNTPAFLFSNPIQANQWLHIVTVYNVATGKKIYLNGALFAFDNLTGTFGISNPSNANNMYNLYLGSHQPTIVSYWSWDGSLDDIRIYNRALSQEEITYLATH